MSDSTDDSPPGRLHGFVELIRPANIVTAWADILAGAAASGAAASLVHLTDAAAFEQIPWLLLATTGLYGGGVVFNDVFDADLDADERPERPIPSGRVSRTAAGVFGAILLVIGVGAAAGVSTVSLVLASATAVLALVYDAYTKHHTVWGPINMGVCRGLNLMLGASLIPASLPEIWYIALLPIAYISAITAISQGEVHGGTRRSGILALTLIGIVFIGLGGLAYHPRYSLLESAPYLLILVGMVLPPFLRAARTPTADHIRSAVHAGVLALIVFDAVLVAGFSGWLTGLLTLGLLPVSLGLGHLFDVT